MLFVGATRYRVPWDFVAALLAGAALVDLAGRLRRRGTDSGSSDRVLDDLRRTLRDPLTSRVPRNGADLVDPRARSSRR